MNPNEEKKLFEEGNVVITNKRFVIGNKQFQMDDIKIAFMEDDSLPFKGALILTGIGFISFFGGGWWFGIIMFVCAYYFWKKIRTKDRLVICMKNDSVEEFLFKNNSHFVWKISNEINNALKYVKELEIKNLHKEMDDLS